MKARRTSGPIIVQRSFSGAGIGLRTCCFRLALLRAALLEAVG